MAKYDIIIAGSGLGGLECAAILSKEGFNVCVLEKNTLFGGCLQTFERKGHRLDTGIHYIGSLDEGQMMHQFFKYFGIVDKLNMRRLDSESFDTIYFKEKIYSYPNGYDRFVDKFNELFPNERKNLKTYVQKLQEVGNLISIDNLKKGIIAQNGIDYFHMSAYKTIDEIFENNDIKQVMAATSMLYGSDKNLSTFYNHAMVNNSYIESAYRFVDGTMQIADELIRVIKENGGTVLSNKEVTRFIVDDNKILAAEVNNEEIYEAKNYISNIHPKKTFELLDKTRYIKNAYISRVNALPNSFGVFSLYLIMKKNAELYQNTNYYIHGTDDVWYDESTSTKKVNYSLICYQANKKSKYTDIVTVLTPIGYSDFKKWENTTFNKRGLEYEELKTEFSWKIINYLKRKGFDYTNKIDSIFSTTPLSYRDYIGSPKGSAYGIMKDYKFPELAFISHKTKLKNLYLTGQNLNVHGALGVTLTSMFTCAEFLGQEYLSKKVGYA